MPQTQTLTERFQPFIFFILTILIIGTFGGSYLAGIAGFDFELSSEDYTGLFVHVLVMTTIAERVTEVYIAIWRKPHRMKLDQQIGAETDPEKEAKAESEKETYRAQTLIQAMYFSFGIGVLISLAGVRILAVLFSANELTSVQGRLFVAIDVMVTAGLIAGGSKGINELAKTLQAGVARLRTGVSAQDPS